MYTKKRRLYSALGRGKRWLSGRPKTLAGWVVVVMVMMVVAQSRFTERRRVPPPSLTLPLQERGYIGYGLLMELGESSPGIQLHQPCLAGRMREPGRYSLEVL